MIFWKSWIDIMESCSYKTEMIIIINELLELLESCENEEDWIFYFKKIRAKIEGGEDMENICKYMMRSCFSGMGSLSDLCLYKNGKPTIEENNRMPDFLCRIYNVCESIMIERRTNVIDFEQKRQERKE